MEEQMNNNEIVIPNIKKGMIVKITLRYGQSGQDPDYPKFGYITGENLYSEEPCFKVYILGTDVNFDELTKMAKDSRVFSNSGEMYSIATHIFEESNIREFTQLVANSLKKRIDSRLEEIREQKEWICDERKELKQFPAKMKEINKKIQKKFL